MNKTYTIKSNKGETLITLLVFMVIAITVTSMSVAIVLNSTENTNKVESGVISLQLAESGIENAILQLIRNPNYSGETMNIDDGVVVVTIEGDSSKTIKSVGTVGKSKRELTVSVGYRDGVVEITPPIREL